jgi:hypothetical protein
MWPIGGLLFDDHRVILETVARRLRARPDLNVFAAVSVVGAAGRRGLALLEGSGGG